MAKKRRKKAAPKKKKAAPKRRRKAAKKKRNIPTNSRLYATVKAAARRKRTPRKPVTRKK